MRARPLSEVLHHYVVPWLQADWPLEWSVLVGRAAPLVVEIGFGNGLALLRQAESHPDTNLIGIELAWGWVQHLAKRLDQAGLDHIRLIHGEAQLALQCLFGSNSIREILINFPDPWPKKRHHARRLIQPEFADLLQDRLGPNGQLTIATDHADYATWIVSALEHHTALQLRLATTNVAELTGRIVTKYEQRARGANVPIYYYRWDKPCATPDTTMAQRRAAMPHVVLEGPHDLEQVLKSCAGRTWRDTQHGIEMSTSLLRAYRELTHDSWLLELVVKEGKLSQQIGVALVPRAQAQILLKLSAIGFPRPTWGVQRAVWYVAQMLQEHSPQLRILWMSMGASEHDPEAVSTQPGRRRGSKGSWPTERG